MKQIEYSKEELELAQFMCVADLPCRDCPLLQKCTGEVKMINKLENNQNLLDTVK
jgi:hypothetical protein